MAFHFDDSSTLTCKIEGTEEQTFLYNEYEHNAKAFYELGISDPHALYKELGILVCEGDCPECKRSDLDKVFKYLLKNYSVEPEREDPERKEPKQSSEWDWLLN